MGPRVARVGSQRNSEGIVMASNNDAMDAYTSGVWDAVALINENEDMELLWSDVLKAIKIKQIIAGLDDGEG